MQRQADPLYTDVTCVLDFLYKIFDSGLSYSRILWLIPQGVPCHHLLLYPMDLP